MRHTTTTYTHESITRHAVRIAWDDVTAFLDHEHVGDSEDDDALTQALCDDDTTPGWLRECVREGATDGAIDQRGWYLLGPSVDGSEG